MEDRHIGARALVGTGLAGLFIQACTVLQGILLARLLGPTGRGELAVVILWPSIFAGLGLFGTDVAISRAAAQERGGRLQALTRTAFVLGLGTAAVSMAIGYMVLPLLLPGDRAHLLRLTNLFLAFILLNHLGLNLIAVDQGAGSFRRFNLSRVILYPTHLFLLLGIWLTGLRGIFWFALAALLAQASVVLFRSGLAWRECPLRGPLFPPGRLLRQGLTFGLARAVETVYQYADKALLLWLLGVHQLGLYAAAVTAGGAINSLANSSGMVTFTMAAQSAPARGFEPVARVFRAVLLLWLLLGGLLMAAMPYLFPLVYGREFAGAVGAAILLVPGAAFAGLSCLLEQTLRGQGRAFVGIEAKLAGLAVMILIGYFVSQTWGMNAVCVAYGAAQATTLAVLAARAKYHYGPAFTFASLLPTRRDARQIAGRIAGSLGRLAVRRSVQAGCPAPQTIRPTRF